MDAGKKAVLITSGKIFVPRTMRLPVLPSKSSAGPGTGNTGIAMQVGEHRFKMGISREPVRFSLVENEEGGFLIMDGDEVFAEDVKVIPTLLHAPGQAFVNIDVECIFRCRFCNTWKLDADKWAKQYSLEKWADLIVAASEKKGFYSVAITTSIPVSVKQSNQKIFRLLKLLEGRLPPGTDIGVEPCMDDPTDVGEFKKRGATELKLNIQAATQDIFNNICPGMDYEKIFNVIKEAGKHLRVCSNIIVGLGETDAEVDAAVERLARLGCAATIRGVRVNDGNREELSRVLGFEVKTVEPDRLVELARRQKAILKNFNIDTRSFHTMCHKCACCDIQPFIDV